MSVAIGYCANELRVVVRDDGSGFTPDEHTSGGFGLAVMRERAALAGGSLSVTSMLGAGTTITATLPDMPTTMGDNP